MDDKKILVLYVDVTDVALEKQHIHVEQISRSMFPKSVIEAINATVFTIPRQGGGTTLECIHPKFILDQEVYREYRIQTDILIEHLNHFNKQKG